MENKLKSVLVSLGMVGSAVIGGVAVDLAQPEVIKEEEIKEPVVVECQSVKLDVEDTELCLDELSYGVVKSALATKYEATGVVDINDLPLMISVLNEEIKAQGGSITLKGSENAFDVLVNQYLK